MSRKQAIDNMLIQRKIEQDQNARKAIANTKFVLSEANPRRFHMSYNREVSPSLLTEWEASWKSTQRELIYADFSTPPGKTGKDSPISQLENKMTWLFHHLRCLSSDMQNHENASDAAKEANKNYDEALELINASLKAIDNVSNSIKK
ncbi:hypothetical protein GCM10009603_07240 [Nocardiopsis exhalans]